MILRKKPSEPADAWTVSKGKHDGRALLVRLNAGAKPLVGRRDMGIQIGVAVPFRKPREDGMPSEEELPELDIIEESLVELFSERAVLVAVLTTGGMREFVAYTGSGDWIPGLDEALQAAITSHKVQVMAKHDPKWTTYTQFAK